MHRPELAHLRSKGWLYVWLLAVVPAVVIASAAAVSAAPAGSADLRITKADSPDPVSVGATLTYAIQVQNLGPDPASGVRVTDQLPKGVDLVSAVPSVGQCNHQGRKVTCDLGALAVSTVVYDGLPRIALTVIPRQAGTIANTASVKADQKDPVASNSKATATTRVVGPVACRGVPATRVGTSAGDVVTGTGGRDVIATLGGNDTVASLAGRDLVCTGSGDDLVRAGAAADRVFGGAGRDGLLGRGGPDVLKGQADNDLLKGNRGSDRLRGGSGFDHCRGGAGFDSVRGCER